MDELDLLTRRLLDRLEQAEGRLLAWGVVDGGFSLEELREHARLVLEAMGALQNVDDLLTALDRHRLLFTFEGPDGPLYRTRMAETVRLLARLRQLFPSRDWRHAPNLVADFRFAQRPRFYPIRRLDPDRVLTDLGSLHAQERRALLALLGEDANPLRLAGFQFRALRQVLRNARGRAARGVIVGAGTGTGKTLAFYLPALAYLCGLVAPNQYGTRVIAIYPRNELLKDQLSEALSLVRRLRYAGVGRPGLRLGAFFGPTPRSTHAVANRSEWPPRGDGQVCPYLRCPGCGGEMVWRAEDLEAGRERLVCPVPSCRETIEEDELALTRDAMSARPPDVLFTTTEMLNRQLGDDRTGHVFVGRGDVRPVMMLLDETHTYTGSHGAQVAMLLRRWRHAVGAPVQFVGLSATLRDAGTFFAQLTGLTPGAIDEIAPEAGEFDPEPESSEYLLALRGDPVSGTSLLSTTIQAAMLLARSLDPRREPPSAGLYGQRLFVFTDDLDVTNRLYNNLQDAEGLDSWNRVVPGAMPLAALRSPTTGSTARAAAGQVWSMAEDIGHAAGLREPLRLGRTSSQDAGVDAGADVIVATAALEVGFNDPTVGAVIQHKSPLDWASFLQRKGRAGRPRRMRPWTAVILSDYGRDRLAYQGYERLFDPELPRRSLPVGNRTVLKIQAAFALMDWLARRLPTGTPSGNVWWDFSGPVRPGQPWSNFARERQRAHVPTLRALLAGEVEIRGDFENHLRASLHLTEDALAAVLWEPPRALYTAVIPTLLRRLETGWRRVRVRENEPDHDYHVANHPLPDFVPGQLFGELNAPEAEVSIPPQTRNADPESIYMSLVQAMRTLTPGRVTRRFGHRHAYSSHWVRPPDLHQPDQSMPVEELCSAFDEAGRFQVSREDGSIEHVRCVRPWLFKPTKPDKEVLPTSNGSLRWATQISPNREENRLRFRPPRYRNWPELVHELSFYTHGERTHVNVRRFATGAVASVRFDDGTENRIDIHFTDGSSETPAAVGFEQAMDGLLLRVRLPADLGVGPGHPNREKVRAFRTGYFRHRVQIDPVLERAASTFQRDWLSQLYLSALAATALSRGVNMREAHSEMGRDVPAYLARVLDVIFRTLDDDGTTRHGIVRDRLQELFANPEVIPALHMHGRILWEPPDDGWQAWASARFLSTLGAAVVGACQSINPSLEPGDLLLDIDPGPRQAGSPARDPDLAEVWITEAAGGGGGAVEAILRGFATDPRRFFSLVEASLEMSDFELVDRELRRLLEWSAEDRDVKVQFAAVRRSASQEELQRSVEHLWRTLADRGLTTTHPVRSAVHARVLRAGTSPATDALMHRLAAEWIAAEESLGIEVEARVFAYLAARRDDSAGPLQAIGSGAEQDPQWRYQAILGLLWPRGGAARSQGLSGSNPFASLPPTDREVVLDLLHGQEPTVPLEGDWMAKVRVGLADYGAVCLLAPADRAADLRRAIVRLAAVPVDVGFLQLYPRAETIRLVPDGVCIVLTVQEVGT